jgi:hypothetical protein
MGPKMVRTQTQGTINVQQGIFDPPYSMPTDAPGVEGLGIRRCTRDDETEKRNCLLLPLKTLAHEAGAKLGSPMNWINIHGMLKRPQRSLVVPGPGQTLPLVISLLSDVHVQSVLFDLDTVKLP